MQSLPPQRQLLGCLAAALSSLQGPRRSLSQTGEESQTEGRRHLLLTLHVLFPEIVLPALDLIDRGLVSRVRRASDGPDEPRDVQNLNYAGRGGGEVGTSDPDQPEPSASAQASTVERGSCNFYVVQSLASTMTRSRGGREVAPSSKTYLVYLDAWSCSCATFALEAFGARSTAGAPLSDSQTYTLPAAQLSPASTDSSSTSAKSLPHDINNASLFGGLSTDAHAGVVPCCKHLLACVLAEVWKGNDGLVDDKTTSRQELAGIAANVS